MRISLPGRVKGKRADIQLQVRPFHELLIKEASASAHRLKEWHSVLSEKELPRAWKANPIISGAGDEELVVPVAIYMDAARYGGSAAAGKQRSILQVSLVNLISGTRHVGLAFRKQYQCRCGCKGWCSVYSILSFLHWCLLQLAQGRWSESAFGGGDWSAESPALDRVALAGQATAFKAAVVYLMLDWEAVVSTMGVPQWNTKLHPCPLCNCSSDIMHAYR
jgi:hypothetical protein